MEAEMVGMCISALVAVFVLLGALSAVMRVMLLVFPARMERSADMAMLAAVTSAVEAAHPGMRVTNIEELD
jgi:hypothetical protein